MIPYNPLREGEEWRRVKGWEKAIGVGWKEEEEEDDEAFWDLPPSLRRRWAG